MSGYVDKCLLPNWANVNFLLCSKHSFPITINPNWLGTFQLGFFVNRQLEKISLHPNHMINLDCVFHFCIKGIVIVGASIVKVVLLVKVKKKNELNLPIFDYSLGKWELRRLIRFPFLTFVKFWYSCTVWYCRCPWTSSWWGVNFAIALRSWLSLRDWSAANTIEKMKKKDLV